MIVGPFRASVLLSTFPQDVPSLGHGILFPDRESKELFHLAVYPAIVLRRPFLILCIDSLAASRQFVNAGGTRALLLFQADAPNPKKTLAAGRSRHFVLHASIVFERKVNLLGPPSTGKEARVPKR